MQYSTKTVTINFSELSSTTKIALCNETNEISVLLELISDPDKEVRMAAISRITTMKFSFLDGNKSAEMSNLLSKLFGDSESSVDVDENHLISKTLYELSKVCMNEWKQVVEFYNNNEDDDEYYRAIKLIDDIEFSLLMIVKNKLVSKDTLQEIIDSKISFKFLTIISVCNEILEKIS